MAGDAPAPASTDRRFMAAAIRLSRRRLGLTADNPSVASLVVQDLDGVPVIVGRGVTARGGRPHAEIQALAEAGEAARGATVYVTLEPCSHIGRSPPCADALVAAGVRRVVVATLDPDIRVAGRGVSILRQAGIEVEIGVCQEEARRCMAGFLTLKGNGRPHVTLKLAVSKDGKIGRAGAGQLAITGPVARSIVHLMRAEQDAVMVGVGTALEDDPLLTVRLDGLDDRTPMRVVLDPMGRMPASARMLAERGRGKVIVLAGNRAPSRAIERLRETGATVEMLDSDLNGTIDPGAVLRFLGLLGIKSLLLEGGAETARRFLEARLVDRIALFSSQVTVGEGGIDSPVAPDAIPEGFAPESEYRFGSDRLANFERVS
jgi:diaminohydroxyphosphoribosylaminopyrimidine deaminase/5-amino-6-(5-phosphoribosylamino)uracil reductase